MFLNSSFYNYLLHDSSIDTIYLDGSNIYLNFNSGFFDYKHNQLENCKIIVTIKDLSKLNINSFINIKKTISKRKSTVYKQILFADFEKMLLKNNFEIEAEYYSDFERAILLVGKVGNYGLEFKITDIDKLDFCFDDC